MTMKPGSYGARLAERCDRLGAFCVGIDPSRDAIRSWGLPDGPEGLETVARTLVDALADRVAVFKPQSAFFEVYGSAGVAVLERTIRAAQAAGAIVILDVKRGDIGSTMSAYAAAYLADDAPLAVDAITASPYLGFGSLAPAFDLAHATGRGVYVLARTSNPEGGETQTAVRTDGRTVCQAIVDDARHLNEATGQGAIGLVIGATHHDIGCDLTGFQGSVLAPGIGAQGGRVADLGGIFGAGVRVLPSASRDVMAAGPDPEAVRARFDTLMSGI